MEPTCRSSCRTARERTCLCECGGANHGVGRIDWAAAILADPDGNTAHSARTQRNRATSALRKRIDGSARRNPKAAEPRRTDAGAWIEHVRTVDLVDWLLQHHEAIGEAKALAEIVGAAGTKALDELGRDIVVRERLGDHFWCDVVAALVIMLEDLQATVAELKQEVADGVATALVADVWSRVEESRRLSRGHFAGQRRDLRARTTRAARDEAAGLAVEVLERTTSFVVMQALTTITAPADASITGALTQLRLVALCLCPDPSAHKAIWDHCLRPLAEEAFASVLSDRLTEHVPQLREDLTWDGMPRELDGLARPGRAGGGT